MRGGCNIWPFCPQRGYSIRREFHGRGYVTEGPGPAIEKATLIIPEEEIYLSVNKDNPASLHFML